MFSIPGKTFLVGEYAVLVGGEALGLATAPRFQIQEDLTEKNEYHSQSAVGLFCKRNQISFFEKIINPYGVGGFGQSTAEFIFAWLKKNKNLISSDLQFIFDEYLNLFSELDSRSLRPSGADLVTQILGRVAHFKNPVQESTSYPWPFADLSFFVISTGLKIKTHEHLENLDREKLQKLITPCHKVIQSFLNHNKTEFVQNLKNWSKELESLSLQHPEVLKIKNTLMKNENILLVKPCGALGADVCLVFCDSSKKNQVSLLLNEQQYQVQATEFDLTNGLCQKESQHLKDHV